MDHKLLSGWKITATANATGKTQTHTGIEGQNEKRTGEEWGQFWMESSAEGSWEDSRPCTVERDAPSPSSNVHVCWWTFSRVSRTGNTTATAVSHVSIAQACGVRAKRPLRPGWRMGGSDKQTLPAPTQSCQAAFGALRVRCCPTDNSGSTQHMGQPVFDGKKKKLSNTAMTKRKGRHET